MHIVFHLNAFRFKQNSLLAPSRHKTTVSFDLFLKHEVFIQAELFSRISHCLLSNAPSLAAVRTVYSHPQPLAQCGGWLRTRLPGAALIPQTCRFQWFRNNTRPRF